MFHILLVITFIIKEDKAFPWNGHQIFKRIKHILSGDMNDHLHTSVHPKEGRIVTSGCYCPTALVLCFLHALLLLIGNILSEKDSVTKFVPR